MPSSDTRSVIGERADGDARHLGEIDRAIDRPPYRQIADLLRAAIRQGRYRPGNRLPSEAALIKHFGVARMTVRHALQELRADGLVCVEHGRGVFVHSTDDARLPAGPLTPDDVMALIALIEGTIGRTLAPDESSRLEGAYLSAKAKRAGATLRELAKCLASSEDDAMQTTDLASSARVTDRATGGRQASEAEAT
ncbi:Mannosyl-D-glycerate transport/metabolism system repressor MngR [Mycobacterium persicum]|uniref:Mannosyl-D-glycerate transport/metabolism system repressor MngR n=1 Tax=Mycobacterium persicum TaxID=1487726 RepID=A0ABY6RSQ8_9MYCO|nr:Mannosyl-D-glycerate transport/metabolism system repressor MngR [Mycobacterium persicum]